MSKVFEVLISLSIGAIFGGLMVLGNKISMYYYKEEYSSFWTKRMYWVLFISITLVFGYIIFFGYYN